MQLFDRQTELVIGGRLYKSDDIDIEFNVPFSTDSEPDISEISIYNLSPASIASITKGTKVTLSAGYKDDTGMIVCGEAASFATAFENVDIKTTIKVSSAITGWKDKKINKTYSPGTSAKDILSDLISGLGVSAGEINPVKNAVYQKGRTVSGRLKDVILKLCRETESKFYIDKDRAYVRAYKKGTGSGFLLSAQTGLIGSPEKAEISEGSKKSKDGWKVSCLLNHNIFADSLIQIHSKTVSGNFRVVKGVHTSDWITRMEVL